MFTAVYRRAGRRGFRLTAHAGEAAGARSVWGALRSLGVERIGHGVRSVEDSALVEHLVDKRIVLEVCPTSKLRTGVVAGWEAASIRPFENVLIEGAGALGIYATALAKHYGCGRIIVADVLDHRLKFVRAFGATDTLNTRQMANAEVVAAVRSLTDGIGVDCVLEVAGSPDLIPIGLQCLRIGGRLIEMGNSFPNAHFNYDACDLVWRRLTLTGVHNYDTRHLQTGIAFLAGTNNQFPFDKLVTHLFNLEEINTALQMAASGEAIRVALLP